MGRLATRMSVLAWIVSLAIGAFILGFLIFAESIDDETPVADRESADGIVVLTGGKSRIAQGLILLAQGKGKRLLITGVYPSTKRRTLKKITPRHKTLFECCIDIDHGAQDTIGNAQAVRDWARARNFKSVIVVTSSYHMLRSLVELRRALPGLKLVAHPVAPKNFRIDAWWAYPGTMRLLLSEYLKLIPAVARFCVSELGRRIAAASAMGYVAESARPRG